MEPTGAQNHIQQQIYLEYSGIGTAEKSRISCYYFRFCPRKMGSRPDAPTGSMVFGSAVSGRAFLAGHISPADFRRPGKQRSRIFALADKCFADSRELYGGLQRSV